MTNSLRLNNNEYAHSFHTSFPFSSGRFYPIRVCHTTALFGLSKNISMTNKEE
ncbi:hypothetical protein HMPREF1553_00687 [Porphyromonas gingivalis F0568]|nr:hypothetical protein HMPREF1553_00687 [Porphyromonas gingivalis F0568]